jgi:hypothetical protein
MVQASKWEYLKAISQRYHRASRLLRQQILNESCANCGYHRKYAIQLLNGPPLQQPSQRRRKRSPSYGPRVISVLSALWEAAGHPWSQRLKVLLPLWMPWARKRFHLTARLEQQLLAISPRTIDHRLKAKKRLLRQSIYGRTKPGTWLKHPIPLKTDCWDVQVPGFTEVDLVAHCGSSAAGEFCHSLNLTDIHTTWVETRAVMGKGQEAVRRAMQARQQALPFQLRGIDSDNGSEFINDHLYRYGRSQQIQFTRGRPYKEVEVGLT